MNNLIKKKYGFEVTEIRSIDTGVGSNVYYGWDNIKEIESSILL